jgi:hypothetical protein
MTRQNIFLHILFFSLIKISLGQDKIDYELFTSIDIHFKDSWTNENEATNEIYSLDSSFLSRQHPSIGLSAFTIDSITTNQLDNKRSFVGYFVNYSNDTIKLDRNDNAIDHTETQILVKNKWVTFQLTLPSDCGNSYFTSNLSPMTYYVIKIPDPTNGNIETKMRVNIIYTNELSIKLTQERIDKTRRKIKPIQW